MPFVWSGQAHGPQLAGAQPRVEAAEERLERDQVRLAGVSAEVEVEHVVARVQDAGHGVKAYTARPMDGGRRGGVVVIHHMPGYDWATKEIVRRFAVWDYNAICMNLYSREAPGAEPDDATATARAKGGVPDARFVGDAAGAVRWLRSLPTSNGKVGTIGFCSGGRQAFLTALELDIHSAVDCYGAFVVGNPPEGFPLQVQPLADRTSELRAPLLGLFGNEDSYPSSDQVDELEKLLQTHGKDYEFHRYDDAGHAFFSPDRPSYRVAAALDGWWRVQAFFAKHLDGEG